MGVLSPRLRSLLRLVRKTPLHPQWLWPDELKAAKQFLGGAHGLVLDVGCAGRWAERHLPAYCAYIGLDYPATGAALYGASPDVFADAACMPFADDSVDTVLMLDVHEHLRLPHSALRECQRVLRPGGKLLMSAPFLYPVHDAPHDYQRLTLHGLQRDLSDAGFSLDWVRQHNGPVEAAGLMMSLALAGSMHEAWRRRGSARLLAPFILALIPVVNIASWFAGRILPDWPALTSGYRLVASKPLNGHGAQSIV